MESALISIVSVALVIIASVTMMMNSFSSINSMMDSWMNMEKQAEAIRNTDIEIVPPATYTGGTIDLFIENDGNVNIDSFDQWDIIARLQTGDIRYIDYTSNSTPGSNQWSTDGIYLSDNTSVPEIFDPNILNPGEALKVHINLDPEITPGEYAQLVASTANGVKAQCFISR